MKTGIVFQVDGRKAIILKSDGSFVSAHAKSAWKEGDVVSISFATQNYGAIVRACAACIALVLLGGLGWNQLYLSPVALISVDVNPSIELSVNRFNRVVSSAALNEEGADILASADNQNIAYQKALANILTAEGARGYLEADANVVLTVFSSDAQRQSALLSELQGVVDANIALYSDDIDAEYHAVDETMISGAHGHGVTAGKYLYLQQLQALEPETDITGYLHHSIEQIKGEIETCKQAHEGENAHEKLHRETENHA